MLMIMLTYQIMNKILRPFAKTVRILKRGLFEKNPRVSIKNVFLDQICMDNQIILNNPYIVLFYS